MVCGGGMRPEGMEKCAGPGRWGHGSAVEAGVSKRGGVAVVGECGAGVDPGVGGCDELE